MKESDGSGKRIVGSALWWTFGRGLNNLADLLFENQQVPLHHGPDFREVNTEIVMNQDMPHGDDL